MMDKASRQELAWLRRAVDFAFVHDVRFDIGSGRLDVHLLDDLQDLSRSVLVLPDYWDDFAQMAGLDDVFVEFEGVEEGRQGRFRLVTQGRRGDGGWDGGVLIRSPLGEPITAQPRPAMDHGLVSAMAAHELKQPLFTISMAAKSIELLLNRHRADDRAGAALEGIDEAVARIRLQVERSHAIMTGIIGYQNPALSGQQAADVRQAMLHAQDFLKPLLDQHDIAVTLALPDEGVRVALSHVALEQVIVNAIQNAVDSLVAARFHGRQARSLTLSAGTEQGMVHCRVSDDGEGMAGEAKREVFRPFFTTKSAQGSLGLGLHISRQIVTNAGGHIDLLPNERHGATLSFALPMYR
jgi:signal transduction histidine kinase